MSSFDARTTRERNGEMISRGEAISPFDARALDFFGPLRGATRNGEMIFRGRRFHLSTRGPHFFRGRRFHLSTRPDHAEAGSRPKPGGGGPAASYSRGNREIAWMECIRDRF